MKTRYLLTTILLAGAVATAQADNPPSELAWVPPGCAGYIHIRVHDFLASDAGKNVLKAVAADPTQLQQIERILGVPLARIDRITVLMPAFDPDARQPGFVVRVATTRAYDRRDVLASLKARAAHPNGRRPTGNLFPLDGDGMVSLDDEKHLTLIPNEEGAVALLGRMLAQRPAAGMALGATEKSLITASVDLTQLPRIPATAIPRELHDLRPLLDAKTITVSIDMDGDKSDLQLRLAFAGKDDAVEAKTLLETGLPGMIEFLTAGEAELGKRQKENAVKLALIKELKDGLRMPIVQLEGEAAVLRVRVRGTDALAHLVEAGVEALRAGSYRSISQNNLKQIGLAMHNYESAYGKLPSSAISDKNGKPLLSWRVAILPFVEQDNMYKQFKLDEPWDSEHNIKLIQHMPKIYALPGDTAKHALPSTYYRVFVGNDAIFDLKKGRSLATIPDGTSNTLLTAEAADPVPWTKPEDFDYDPKVMPKIGFHFNGTCNVGFADGSVRALKKTLEEKIWHMLIQASDGNPIPPLDD